MKYTKENLLYFDCEWTPVSETFNNLKSSYPKIANVFEHQVQKWEHQRKIEGLQEFGDLNAWWEEKAHFYPEYCQIICVSYGYFNKGNFILQSVFGKDEKQILIKIAEVFKKINEFGLVLSGYGIKRFDMPWLSKRMMSKNIKPPSIISTYGKKPWDIDVFDLPEVWGQGNMQESYTPFEVACVSLDIETSKDDLTGAKVKEAYWNGELERIKKYCERDVEVSMKLATKLIDLLP